MKSIVVVTALGLPENSAIEITMKGSLVLDNPEPGVTRDTVVLLSDPRLCGLFLCFCFSSSDNRGTGFRSMSIIGP